MLELVKKVLELCRQKSYRIVTAESLTAGLISSALASVSGASDMLLCGFTVYTAETKEAILDISPFLIKYFGIVSPEVAKSMATSALITADTFTKNEKLISIGVTGIAGPTGGTEKTPNGTVCFALSYFLDQKVIYCESETFNFIGERNEVRNQTVDMALKKIIEKLKKI